jgi:hypothetical protein
VVQPPSAIAATAVINSAIRRIRVVRIRLVP